MDLSRKKTLKAKYLLSGYSKELPLLNLCRFCIVEAKSQLPINAGDKMIADKATKFAGEMVKLFNNKELFLYIGQNRLLMRKIRLLSGSKKKAFSRKTIIKLFKKYLRSAMESLIAS